MALTSPTTIRSSKSGFPAGGSLVGGTVEDVAIKVGIARVTAQRVFWDKATHRRVVVARPVVHQPRRVIPLPADVAKAEVEVGIRFAGDLPKAVVDDAVENVAARGHSLNLLCWVSWP
ncbi:hypothetical protein [Adonisia turfae]|uniref:hypothetical protein n=1 Tax=Adonisia turfae TaxID=2950184 RepID=UPI003D6F73B2